MDEALWSSRDEATAATCRASADAGDLMGALLAVEDALEVRDDLEQVLAEWAKRVGERVRSDDPVSAAAALQVVLGRELGLRGDKEDYHAPQNSFLTAVVERRRGLPILLSSVWMLVGERAGIDVAGIGLPGHFIARIGDGDGVFVDPFEGGAAMTLEDCKERVARLSDGRLDWQDEFVAPAGTRTMIERVLRNLVNAWAQFNELPALYRAVRTLAIFRPDDAGAHLAHARVAELIGARQLAKDVYLRVLELTPDSPAGAVATARLRELESDPTLLN